MGFLITVEDEDGARVDEVQDPSNLLGRLLPEDSSAFALIGSIDPFGDTIFNRLQIRRFLEEWKYVVDSANGDDEKRIANAVKAIALRVSTEPHLYLKFYGE